MTASPPPDSLFSTKAMPRAKLYEILEQLERQGELAPAAFFDGLLGELAEMADVLERDPKVPAGSSHSRDVGSQVKHIRMMLDLAAQHLSSGRMEVLASIAYSAYLLGHTVQRVYDDADYAGIVYARRRSSKALNRRRYRAPPKIRDADFDRLAPTAANDKHLAAMLGVHPSTLSRYKKRRGIS